MFYDVFLPVFYSVEPSRLGNIVNRVTALLCVSAGRLWVGGEAEVWGSEGQQGDADPITGIHIRFFCAPKTFSISGAPHICSRRTHIALQKQPDTVSTTFTLLHLKTQEFSLHLRVIAPLPTPTFPKYLNICDLQVTVFL